MLMIIKSHNTQGFKKPGFDPKCHQQMEDEVWHIHAMGQHSAFQRKNV
jgi:hypothetical protein